MNFLSLEEVVESLKNQGISSIVENENQVGDSIKRINVDKPYQYWKLSIILALIFVIAEMLVIKLWKKTFKHEITS